jgi:hypothetical protein
MTINERNAKREALLNDFHESGLTQKAFCERHNLPIGTLQYWLGRERKKTWAQRPTDVVSVGVVKPTAGTRLLRVMSSAGVTIEVERPVSETELATILKAISAS